MTAPMTLDRLRGDVAAALSGPVSSLDDHENLLDLGLDSIRIMSLVELWRGAGFDPSYLDLAEQPTLAAWWALLSAQNAAATS
jgi:bifunctional isochorismate lyase/aryl carrier protein